MANKDKVRKIFEIIRKVSLWTWLGSIIVFLGLTYVLSRIDDGVGGKNISVALIYTFFIGVSLFSVFVAAEIIVFFTKPKTERKARLNGDGLFKLAIVLILLSLAIPIPTSIRKITSQNKYNQTALKQYTQQTKPYRQPEQNSMHV